MSQAIRVTGNVQIGKPFVIRGKITIGEPLIVKGKVIMVQKIYPPTYKGEYEIVPKVSEQILDTDKKMMADDLTVTAITYSKTTNEKGGLTVQIGEI